MDFEHLFEPCKRSLYYTALHILMNADDAKDALQETAYAALKNFKQLRSEDMFQTWITRILLNNCYKIYRKNKRTTISLQDLDAVWFDEINEDESLLLNALCLLKPKEKAVILLRYTNDLKFEDIAKIMLLPTNTVKSIHVRSLAKLKKAFELEAGYDECKL